MDRRNFVGHVAALALGAAGAAGLDVDRLIALLPPVEPTSTRRIGTADVETIEQATVTFARQDFAQSSGLSRGAAVAHLRSVLPLLEAQATPKVRARLSIAAADLAAQAGYMSFDVKHHDAARRLWMIALDIARTAEDPRGHDLSAFLLYDMALQAVHLNRTEEALRLVHLGHAAVAGSHPISASTTGCLASIQARVHAAQGDTRGCDRALGHAVEQFSSIDRATTPPWGTWIDEAVISGYQGAAHYTLALVSVDPRAAGRAVMVLSHAVDGFGPDHARSRALYLPDLAGAHAIAGDADTAVTVGHQAVEAVAAVHSPRAHDRLRVLNTTLEPLHASPGVADLRDRLVATAA